MGYSRWIKTSLLALAAAAALVGFAASGEDAVPAAPPKASGPVFAISEFDCDCDPAFKQSVQATFMEVFANSTNANLKKGKAGDLVLVGTLIPPDSELYVSGILAKVYKGDTVIASRKVDLTSKYGQTYLAMVASVGTELAAELIRQNELAPH